MCREIYPTDVRSCMLLLLRRNHEVHSNRNRHFSHERASSIDCGGHLRGRALTICPDPVPFDDAPNLVLSNARGFTNVGSFPGVLDKLQELSQQSITTQQSVFGHFFMGAVLVVVVRT
jgi:hypothetical protein